LLDGAALAVATLALLLPGWRGLADAQEGGAPCASTPRSDCRAARRMRLLLRHSTNESRDVLVWKWRHGEETALGDFGAPSTSTRFTLCLYAGEEVATITLPVGPRWRPKGAKGWELAAPGVADGIHEALLVSGAAGKSKIVVEGRGPSMARRLAPPLALPVSVQLVNDANDTCFESFFTSATRNDPTRFKARVKVGSGDRTHQYAIAQASDCERVRDYPYARNLFCPGAFAAVATVVATVAESLGADGPSDGYFHYYQTEADPEDPPDDQSQTRTACLLTEAPWGSPTVAGAGTPLCHLLAYVTSPGQLDVGSDDDDDPVPVQLRAFPDYFTRLYLAGSDSLLDEFQSGAAFDPIVRNLGAQASDDFLLDYPAFATDALYDPAEWRSDPQYHGISGGGGGGWGGEISLALPGEEAQVLLAFGGGGGGGMTSTRSAGVVTSYLGSGGGGGMQLADGYRFEGQSYDGLGLGAGTSSEEATVEYSYYDYAGSGRPAEPVDEYDPDVIADYQEQIGNLIEQLRDGLLAGGTVVVQGGGGMGAGAEYLMADGEEFVPHALSTQAGFSFGYEFRSHPAALVAQQDDDAEDDDVYAQLGDFYQEANAEALAACGDDYSNYSCICPKQQAVVIALTAAALGDASEVPSWLEQQQCPDTDSSDALVGGASSRARRVRAARAP